MPNIGITELIIILVILLLLFGSTRLPQLAKGMGKSIREFKKGIADGDDEHERELADARRDRLSEADRERLSDEERRTSDNFTVNKPR
ncbi:MAG TPA: twin-arginine translocase TatA/TatE family subunit [Pyrinomonadaceae bacterium]|nr:twin-arginine translocase TatA/TatE family subunit [Pyrinomonadaceae bacterium]